jgi:hypothetical protein
MTPWASARGGYPDTSRPGFFFLEKSKKNGINQIIPEFQIISYKIYSSILKTLGPLV